MAARLKRAPFSVHLGLYADETAALCGWHVPESHPLESWSDLRATDGTASLVQPLIRPLYATRTAHELLAAFSGRFDAAPYDLVRETWRRRAVADFETWWRQALHDGVVAGSAAKPAVAGAPRLPAIQPLPEPDGLSLVLAPRSLRLGRPLRQQCLAAGMPQAAHQAGLGQRARRSARRTPQKLGLKTGDVVRIAANGASTRHARRGHAGARARRRQPHARLWPHAAPARSAPASAPTPTLLRTTRAPWMVEGVALAKTGRRREVLVDAERRPAGTGRARPLSRPLRWPTWRTANPSRATRGRTELLPGLSPTTGHAWGMVIDTQACIGCNACVVACQAENNVPVVGPEEIARGRDMHWLRIDIYDHGTPEQPQPGFQPVPCMHCEKAPCEPVCPVAASVHDSEGLNVQVYNRCVGTRFCEANCPYKVRRFNFFGYADGQEYANLGAEPFKAQNNPDVTVRARGVMEKCTYCVQRISRARRDGREARTARSPDGEVVTACQAACPTRAIVFGDLNNPGAGRARPARRIRATTRCSATSAPARARPISPTCEPEPGARRRRRMSAALDAARADPSGASRGSRPSTRATPPSRPP